jgi:hypothetical protein
MPPAMARRKREFPQLGRLAWHEPVREYVSTRLWTSVRRSREAVIAVPCGSLRNLATKLGTAFARVETMFDHWTS